LNALALVKLFIVVSAMKRLPTPAKTSVAGFTIIELLVVIIIAGILAAIAAPGWVGFLNRQRANSVRSDLIATLKNTQQDAIQRRQSRQIKVIEAAATPTVEVGPLSLTGFSQTLGSDTNNPGKVTLDAYAVQADGTKVETVTAIAFDYRGLPVDRTSLPFVIAIKSGGATAQQCVIVANLLGSVKVATNAAECANPRVIPN
jgi:prepilin-type N-terminal cleavage/methylation domain-containing protein